MPTLIPTGGLTYCTVETGSFPKTYDGYTATYCCFKRNQTCLSEWYWNTPVNVTSFKILSLYYYPNSRINGIWGRVNGSWVKVWDGTWKPAHNVWDSKSIDCDNCTGIRISQTHVQQPSRPCIVDVKVDYTTAPPPPPPPPEEGKATIISITKPDTFTPGESFTVKHSTKNNGGDDTLFARLINTDTGAILKESTHYTASGVTWGEYWTITLTQTTDFHGRVEAGHEV